ncbi:uncharacterized protein LOC111036183 [Myzus persicae]|uniref:uncharacterized protein LOC111036183 n=1 Tax=Myzus persicae TaxID=13164 RepID=UPI000B937D05|nr:uncharacterized protein LOC111036183 [Myzus persicae]
MYELKYVDCIIYLRILKIDEILSFNDEHSKIIYEIYDTDNPDLPVVTTVDELQEYTNYVTQIFTDTNETIIDWKEYLTIIFMDVKNVTLDFETDLIQIYNFEYFEALFKLIMSKLVMSSIYGGKLFALFCHTLRMKCDS